MTDEPPPSVISRACTSKVCYPTPAAAVDAIRVAHLTYASRPMSYYACPHCPGFHLTSAPQDGAESPWLPDDSPMPKRDPREHVRSRVHRYRSLQERAKRERYLRELTRQRRLEESERALDRLPAPHVASEDEVRAFFAQHS